MRKANAILAICITVLFLFHLIAGSLKLFGLMPGGGEWFRILSWLMVALILVHVAIGVKLSIDTIIASRKAGVSYLRQNKLFWLRRISGFAMLLFMGAHIFLFSGQT
ncbi:MAG: pilus assembly protein PilX, partial [Lachnospiraceae bacterium]|nr:pilus assembly protein PilX [Lachnospiraceae bacterium]